MTHKKATAICCFAAMTLSIGYYVFMDDTKAIFYLLWYYILKDKQPQ